LYNKKAGIRLAWNKINKKIYVIKTTRHDSIVNSSGKKG